MISFLFWNINKKPLAATVARLSHLHQVDVLLLAECNIHPAHLLQELNDQGDAEYHYSPGACEKIQVFTRFPEEFLRPIDETHRLTIRRLALPGLDELLVAAVHFVEKQHHSPGSQKSEAGVLSRRIREVEGWMGHSRTVLIGDFNMDPFESGMIGAEELHAVMTARIASRGTRVVQGRECPFFYNPMWGHFGDSKQTPPGTYYYERAEAETYFWHMFDQVLLRPELIRMLATPGVQIVTNDGDSSLTRSDGRPDMRQASDHLPLLFSLTI